MIYPLITIKKHRNACYSLALIDYSTHTIYLGSNVHSDDIEGYIEDTLTHEYMHYILFKLCGIEIAKMYERIYGEVEPKGRVMVIGVQGVNC